MALSVPRCLDNHNYTLFNLAPTLKFLMSKKFWFRVPAGVSLQRWWDVDVSEESVGYWSPACVGFARRPACPALCLKATRRRPLLHLAQPRLAATCRGGGGGGTHLVDLALFSFRRSVFRFGSLCTKWRASRMDVGQIPAASAVG